MDSTIKIWSLEEPRLIKLIGNSKIRSNGDQGKALNPIFERNQTNVETVFVQRPVFSTSQVRDAYQLIHSCKSTHIQSIITWCVFVYLFY